MTFFVGNDFLPHLPALDIGDEAFDLLFYAYKKNRTKWLKDGFYSRSMATSTEVNDKTKSKRHPYLTDAGRITSGKVGFQCCEIQCKLVSALKSSCSTSSSPNFRCSP